MVLTAKLYTRKTSEKTFHFVQGRRLGPWSSASKFGKVTFKTQTDGKSAKASVPWSYNGGTKTVLLLATPTSLTKTG